MTSANILPFPARPAADPGSARLRRSLQGLNQALSEQSAALAAWRSALVELQAAIGSLGRSLEGYAERLGTACTRSGSEG